MNEIWAPDYILKKSVFKINSDSGVEIPKGK
jgi:hypothetical protein